MRLSHMKSVLFALFLFGMLFLVGCGGKKTAAAPAPPPPVTPPPAAPAPAITLRAEPATIERGGSTTLTWEARNAASVTIAPELGTVPVTGNRSVNPGSSVTYTATATGPGGTANDIARVTVNVPAASTTPVEPPRRPDVSSGGLAQNVSDVLFDYDKADLRPEMVDVLKKNASWLKTNANVRFTIEGYCDERGSEEYNLGLGDRRANVVKEFLVAQGVAANRINTVSYGEERPACREQTEECFAKNRRAHFAQMN
jgi:peptidoglycan-associated lipoprotein